MHVKFLAHGRGSGQGAVAYVLGERDHKGEVRAGVTVLRGNPILDGQLIDSLSTVNRYTSGVLAFHRDDKPTTVEINRVLDEFERVAFAGLEREQYTYSAVAHLEKDGSVHVHLLVPNVELTTGKAMNIAPPGWEKPFGAMRDLVNAEYGWAKPSDPRLARQVQPGRAALLKSWREDKDPRQSIEREINRLVVSGAIQSRADVLKAFEAWQMGINREGKDYTSVVIEGRNKPVRLKGPAFAKAFDLDTVRLTADAAFKRPAGREAPSKAEAEVARARMQESIDKRAAYNAQRYPAPPKMGAQQQREFLERMRQEVAREAPVMPKAEDRTEAMREVQKPKQGTGMGLAVREFAHRVKQARQRAAEAKQAPKQAAPAPARPADAPPASSAPQGPAEAAERPWSKSELATRMIWERARMARLQTEAEALVRQAVTPRKAQQHADAALKRDYAAVADDMEARQVEAVATASRYERDNKGFFGGLSSQHKAELERLQQQAQQLAARAKAARDVAQHGLESKHLDAKVLDRYTRQAEDVLWGERKTPEQRREAMQAALQAQNAHAAQKRLVRELDASPAGDAYREWQRLKEPSASRVEANVARLEAQAPKGPYKRPAPAPKAEPQPQQTTQQKAAERGQELQVKPDSRRRPESADELEIRSMQQGEEELEEQRRQVRTLGR